MDGDPQAYERVVAAFYRGLFDAGLSADVVAPYQLPQDPAEMVRRWPVLVVPALYIADGPHCWTGSVGTPRRAAISS